MNNRFKFRIPMFTDKDTFTEFQYLELGEQEECTLCGYNGEPQQCTGFKDKNGKLIRQERYAGTMQRSFYVGEEITEEEIKAKYESGVLTLTIPKKEAKKLPEKKLISIE